MVTNITQFGAFVNLGLPMRDSYMHLNSPIIVSDPNEVVVIGQQVKASVLGIDRARQRISLHAQRCAVAHGEQKMQLCRTASMGQSATRELLGRHSGPRPTASASRQHQPRSAFSQREPFTGSCRLGSALSKEIVGPLSQTLLDQTPTSVQCQSRQR